MRTAILAFAAGILWLQFQPELPSWWVGAMASGWLLVVAGGCLLMPVVRRSLLLVGCVLLGLGYATWRADMRLVDRLDSAWEGKDVELVGTIAELPQHFNRGSRFRFAVEEVKTPGAVVPKEIMLSWYFGGRNTVEEGEETAGKAIRPGERWRLTARLKQPHGNANPHGFDYEAWLLERGIRAVGYVRSGGRAEKLAEMVWSPNNAIERLRDGVRNSFQAMLPDNRYPYAGVLVALVIGDQRAINGDLWNTFNRTGTTHLMSISGLHITMIALLASTVAGWIWRRVPALALRLPTRRAAVVAGVLAALFYTLIAGFAVPAQRTLYMLIVAALALYSGRRLVASRVLCWALLVVLLFDPWAVLAVGFWLSFGAVGALLYMGSAQVGHEVGGWRQKIQNWGAVQWAATLASLPVLLLIFQQFSLISPVANAVAVPVVSFVVTPLALLAMVVPWWPLLELAHGVMAWLMRLLEWCALAPVWQATAPPLWVAVVAALGVGLLLLPRGVPGRLAGVAMLLPVLFWPAPRPPENEAWIDVLDVGQGLAVLVRTRDRNLLYDTGPLYSAESNAGQRIVVPYLRALGINRLDMLMVTHGDADHAGGAASVRAALPVGSIYSSVPEMGGGRCLAGQSWNWNGVRFGVLHPDEADYRQAGKSNNVSCVLRVEAGGKSMLLTSDIEVRDEKALLARGTQNLSADVMLVPHQGSRTSSSPAFLAATGARQAVLSVGYRNRFGHPKAEILARYEALGAEIWRTDTQGAILVRLAAGQAEVRAWRDVKRRYWHGR